MKARGKSRLSEGQGLKNIKRGPDTVNCPLLAENNDACLRKKATSQIKVNSRNIRTHHLQLDNIIMLYGVTMFVVKV